MERYSFTEERLVGKESQVVWLFAFAGEFFTFLLISFNTGCMVYEKLGEQVFGTPGKMIVFGSTSLQNIGGKGDLGYLKTKQTNKNHRRILIKI